MQKNIFSSIAIHSACMIHTNMLEWKSRNDGDIAYIYRMEDLFYLIYGFVKNSH